MSSILGNNIVSSCLLPPLDHYRLQLYNYAMFERLRNSHHHHLETGRVTQSFKVDHTCKISSSSCNSGNSNNVISLEPVRSSYPLSSSATTAAASAFNPYGPRFALSMSLFQNRVFRPEEPKPQHSYIGLIAMAILTSPDSKLVLSDIYKHILDNYPYFRNRGPGWRNSIRHNLSLNDCFIKAGRSANGKGHYWAIHPANIEDFKKGDFRRRKAQRKVRKHMGLSVDDEGPDSPSPPPLAVSPPTFQTVAAAAAQSGLMTPPHFFPQSWAKAAAAVTIGNSPPTLLSVNSLYATVTTAQSRAGSVSSAALLSSRKRQFDVASLLAPDDDNNYFSPRFRFANNQQYQHQIENFDQQIQTCSQNVLPNSETATAIQNFTSKAANFHQELKDEKQILNRNKTTSISFLNSCHYSHHNSHFGQILTTNNSSENEEDIDVVASDIEDQGEPEEFNLFNELKEKNETYSSTILENDYNYNGEDNNSFNVDDCAIQDRTEEHMSNDGVKRIFSNRKTETNTLVNANNEKKQSGSKNTRSKLDIHNLIEIKKRLDNDNQSSLDNFEIDKNQHNYKTKNKNKETNEDFSNESHFSQYNHQNSNIDTDKSQLKFLSFNSKISAPNEDIQEYEHSKDNKLEKNFCFQVEQIMSKPNRNISNKTKHGLINLNNSTRNRQDQNKQFLHNWPELINQWPSRNSNTTVDTRILERYYEQYMAAAAAVQQRQQQTIGQEKNDRRILLNSDKNHFMNDYQQINNITESKHQIKINDQHSKHQNLLHHCDTNIKKKELEC